MKKKFILMALFIGFLPSIGSSMTLDNDKEEVLSLLEGRHGDCQVKIENGEIVISWKIRNRHMVNKRIPIDNGDSSFAYPRDDYPYYVLQMVPGMSRASSAFGGSGPRSGGRYRGEDYDFVSTAFALDANRVTELKLNFGTGMFRGQKVCK